MEGLGRVRSAACGKNRWSDEPMHWPDGEHVQAPKRVVNMDHCCDRNQCPIARWKYLAMDAKHYIEVLVFVSKQRFVERILEQGEDSDPVTCGVR